MDTVSDLQEADIVAVVRAFYARVRADSLLGPVFGAAVLDWRDHHARLDDFWSSIMLTTGRYKGDPIALHLRHAPALTPEAFERWLHLWKRTTDELLAPEVAAGMQRRATRIADRLLSAAQIHTGAAPTPRRTRTA